MCGVTTAGCCCINSLASLSKLMVIGKQALGLNKKAGDTESTELCVGCKSSKQCLGGA